MKKVIPLFLLVTAVLGLLSCSKDGLEGGGALATSFPSVGSPSPGGGGGQGTPGVITAGEWNDLDNWDFWKEVLDRDTIKTFPGLWGFYTNNRFSVILRDAGNRLVHNARLILRNGSNSFTGVTDNFGKAEIFPGLYTAGYGNSSFQLTAHYRGVAYDLGSVSLSSLQVTKNLPVAKVVDPTLDIQFVVDATGSMGDEISYLKTELNDVISRAGVQLPGVQIRMGSVFYRDHGDDYLVRKAPFTTEVGSLISFIRDQSAGGGGDTPEAVEEALDESINKQDWSAQAVNRLLFLVLDAPPHNEPAVMNKLKAAVKSAQEKGIRIIPVTASGIDRPTEFLMRFLSISTSGTYVFITNHSGIGNDHLKPTVGNYQVEYLNNLMVRLITKYGQNKD